MKFHQLGKTQLKVSEICLGTMTWGEQNTEAEAHEQMSYATENGVNFFDAAEMYPVPPRPETQGLTEQYIGTWLQKNGRRDQVILATKIASTGNFDHIRTNSNLKAEQIIEAVESSLKRLQTDYIDLYQLHWPSRDTNCFGRLGYPYTKNDAEVSLEESLKACDILVKQGKIRHVGLSNETPWGVSQSLLLSMTQNLPRVASIQNPYSLLNRTFEVGLSEFSHREAVGLLAYSPLAFGVLSGKYLNGARPKGARLSLYERFQRYTSVVANEVTQQYVDIAHKYGLDPAQMALAFVNSRPFLTSNIIGATTMDQLKSNIASADIELSAEVLADIEVVHAGNSNPCP
jgi:aryl-alcohol dehydrogenase-like predicted oxidoreductase